MRMLRLPPSLAVLALTSMHGLSAVAQTAEQAQRNDNRNSSGTTLQEFDNAWEDLRMALWQMQNLQPYYGKDLRNRSLSDDLRDQMLVSNVRNRLQQQRALASEALAAGREQQASALLDATQTELLKQRETYRNIITYWEAHQAVRANQHEWQRLLRDYPAAGLLTRAPAVLALQQRYEQQVKNNQLAQAEQTAHALTEAMSAEREAAMSQFTNDAPLLPRLTPCTADSLTTSGAEKPRFSRSLADIASYYPAQASRWNQHGAAILRVQINQRGCVIAAAVTRSSGTAALDTAALQWIENAIYLPAERNGQAIDTETQLKVNFRISNEPPPAAR